MLPEIQHDRREFGARLREARRARGYPPHLVAEFAQIQQETLRRFEAGERSPKLETAMRLAAVLGMPLEDLLPTDYRDRLRPPAAVLEWFSRRAGVPAGVPAEEDAGNAGTSRRSSTRSHPNTTREARGVTRRADQAKRQRGKDGREGGVPKTPALPAAMHQAAA